MAAKGSSKMKLYWYPIYRSMRNIWLIKEMGVEDDFEYIKLKPGEDAAADAAFKRDVHPHGTIPALVIPGEPPMLESTAICLYLADKYGKLVPDNKDRRDYYDLLIYGSITLDEVMHFYYYHLIAKTLGTKEEEKVMRVKLNTSLAYLNRRLEGREYLCGNSFTAADCVLAYSLYFLTLHKDEEFLKPYPKVQDYMDRMNSRPAFQSALNMK